LRRYTERFGEIAVARPPQTFTVLLTNQHYNRTIWSKHNKN
jgi:hypothetical protein